MTVEGNASVGVGAYFYATGSKISGNLSASAADTVETGIGGGLSPIDGNVSIDSTTDDVYLDAPVGGNARFTDNNVLVFNGVHFGRNLACSGNSYVYFYFSNTVTGHASSNAPTTGAWRNAGSDERAEARASAASLRA